MKKTKKALALALALAVAGTTNLGGLENIIKVEAATSTETIEVKEVIDGIEWVFTGTKTNGTVTNTSTTITSDYKVRLGNRGVTVPNKIGGYDVTVLDKNTFKDTNLTSLKIDNPNLVIQNSCFEECNYLETIDINCKSLGSGTSNRSFTFYGCDMLKTATICTEVISGIDFYNCNILEKVNLSSPTNKLYIGSSAFSSCTSLKNLTFSDTLEYINFGKNAFFACNQLEDLIIPGKASIDDESFKNCINLRDVEFLGEVTSMGKNAFANSFLIDEEGGKQIEKTITFRGSMITGETAFANCEGLTNVVLSDNENASNRFLGNNVFEGCKNLSKIDYGKGYNNIYGDNIYSNCPEYKSICALKLNINSNKSLSESSIETIEISENNNTLKLGGDKLSTIKKIFLGGDMVYGNINLNNLPNLQSIIFANPTVSQIYITTSGTTNAMIYGYDSSISSNGTSSVSTIAKWAADNNLVFKSIISDLNTSYDGEIIGITDVNAIDKSKIRVTACKSYLTDSLTSEEVEPSTDGSDLTGYVLILPDKLTYGENIYRVVYGGQSTLGILRVIDKKAIELNVDWKENEIDELVSNQPIAPADVISGASIIYNDGTCEYVTASQLTLNKTVTTAGDNTFVATLNGTDIKAEKTFSIKENYITAIKAEYESKDILYVGDSIDTSKIKLTATYKYDADTTVNRNISFTKISSSQLTTAGDNIITVYYNDLSTQMIIPAKVADVQSIYAVFDKQYSYVQGQESVDPKSIAVTITFNDGTTKTGSDINYDYEIIETAATNSTLQVVVKYKGILSNTIDIPITPKEITSIKASANIASATEGTTLTKTIIDKIELTYNNGKTETLDATTIDYDSLSFNDYVIKANEKNTITVNYAGKSTEITIVGVSNTITTIYAEYIGSGQTVGTQIPVSDVSVHAINSNGQITNITDGVLLENAIPYNVGPNTVTVHYGSFSCTITVTGLPASATTTEPSISPDAPEKTNTPEPAKTSQPDTTTAPTGTVTPNSTTVVPTPDTANNAPVVTNTSITVTSNNKKIKTATDKTYKVYTNKTVTLTINGVSSSAIKYQVVAKGAKISDTAWKDVVNNKITVSKTEKPSIVYIQYTDANGMIQTIHTNGFTIDKKKATVNVKKNETYKAGKKVTFKDASGIKSAKLDGKKVKSGIKIKKKGMHTLVVTDKAGNKITVKFKIK